MRQRIILAARALLGISILGILSVSLMAFHSPQSVMDLVQVTLPNTDSMSSIRGVFGGAGLTISIILIRLAIKNPLLGVQTLSLLWGSYACSRMLTHWVDGPLGAFGIQWLIIESILCLLSLLVWRLGSRAQLI